MKSDLKVFEYTNNLGNQFFSNPKSGLIIDENVIQKNKFEFYMQPQYVNQETSTFCHYQAMDMYQHSDDIF